MADILNNVKPSTAGDPAALETPNYISQINAGGTLYDIATHHGIKFFNGAADNKGIKWNGITDLEVVIPTIADLVSSPVQFVGTVGSDGTIHKAEGISNDIDVTNPKAGYLVFITANCTFRDEICEAGDMAVHDGSKWNVVTGENQVEIVGVGSNNEANVVLTGDAKKVLTVEGKALKLSIDYAGVNGVLSVSKNAETTVESSGKATVSSKYITFKQGDASTETIGVEHTINVPTALANGNVNFGENAFKVFKDNDISFNEGKFPTPKTNDGAITVDASASNQTITVTEAEDGKVLTGVTLGNAGDYVTSINVVDDDNKVFLTGWHKKSTDAGNSESTAVADFKFVDNVSLGKDTTFYKSLSDTDAAGADVIVSNITAGSATGTFVTGFGKDVTSVVTKITDGSIVVDMSKTDFVNGLGSDTYTGDYDVLTSYEFNAGGLTGGQNTNVFSSATVTEHVLSFETSPVVSSIGTYTAPTFSAKGKKFTKAGVTYTAPTATNSTFETGSVDYTAPTATYKKLGTGTVTLNVDSNEYMWDKKKANKYTAVTKPLGLTSSKANITVDKATITATIPENTVVTEFNAGILPTLKANATGVLSATVDTKLTTNADKFYIVGNESAKLITIPGSYTLGESDTKPADGTSIEVGKSGEIDVTASGKISANSFITDVYVNENKVSDKKNA